NGITAADTAQAYSGVQSLKLAAAAIWNGTGIRSQEKRCSSPTDVCGYQDPWSVDMLGLHALPSTVDRLTFWVKPQSANGMSNNIEVKLFDHGDYRDGTSGAKIWTQRSATYSEWSRLSVPVALIKAAFPTLNLSDINKIELGSYWPGTYYFDDIRMPRGQEIRIAADTLSSGLVSWAPVVGAAVYTLQESTAGLTGPWKTIYTGPDPLFAITHLTPSWLRVRWETAADPAGNLVPYYSDWSDTAFYKPRPVLLSHQLLQQYGYLEWSHIPQADSYLLQRGASPTGPWINVYEGGYRVPPPLRASIGKWYSVRGQVTDTRGKVTEVSPWSPALLFDPSNFIRATGIKLKDRNGAGSTVILHGFNLGNYLLLEYWMTGLSWVLERQPFIDAGLNYDAIVPSLIAEGYAATGPDNKVRVKHPFTGLNNEFRSMFPGFTGQQFAQIETIMEPDDWRIRQALGSRAKDLMKTYQNAYIQDIDLDNMMDMGANFIRLPVYYRDIRDINDQTGQWLEGSTYNFETIDRIVNLCADRGIAVLIDLHGAPGAQSGQFHTGRTGFNKLFAPDALGGQYRSRTKELWQEIAKHYRFNTTVMGYDLLNEPIGFLTYSSGYAALWQLYNDLYHVIRDANRAADTNHVIVMEGAWDWDSLPAPVTYRWQNVMYQFHYYCWGPAEGQKAVLGEQCPAAPVETQINYQKAYIDAHLAASRQSLYNVPVLIGEFNGFGQKEVWQYYLKQFNQRGYSWSVWSYKNHDHATSWGVYDHFFYNEALPDFQYDSQGNLEAQLGKYDTLRYHVPNKSLINIIKTYM
ncbi:MAG: cellulase family glycosylhydrolase, partial [Candidatus Omnitrophota bacterium]